MKKWWTGDRVVEGFPDNEIGELNSLLADQNRIMAGDLSAHLYSVYLHRLQSGRPRPRYARWPVENPPIDGNFYMEDDETLASGGEEEQYEREEDDVEDLVDPMTPLLTAFDTYLRRQVYKRIHNQGLDPILDMEPRAGQLGIDLGYKVLEILNNVPREVRNDFDIKSGINWRDLNIRDPRVVERMEELYPTREWPKGDEFPDEAADLGRKSQRRSTKRAVIDRLRVPNPPKPFDHEEVTTLGERVQEGIDEEERLPPPYFDEDPAHLPSVYPRFNV